MLCKKLSHNLVINISTMISHDCMTWLDRVLLVSPNWTHATVSRWRITGINQFSSVQSLSRAWLCDPVNRSTPGLPDHHQLPEFTQTHVHRVSDAIQPSHPLSSPSPPAPNPSQHQSFPMSQHFAWGGQSTGVSALASVLPKKSQGWSPSEWTGWIMQSKGLSTPQCKSIYSSALSFLHSPTLTSTHDHRKNHSLD